MVHLSELERADCLRLVPCGHRGAATSWAIRIPAPYSVLLAKKRWASVMFPYVRGVRADGGGEIRAMTIPWGELGVARPAVLRRMWQGGVASLDGSALQDVADFLRKRLPEGGDERLQVERLIVAAQAVADDAHADVLKRRIILSSPTANVINRRYRHDFVVKSFIIGCCVKSVARMPDIVREITHTFLGDASAHMLHDVIETLADLQVSKSLISRNRLLSDAIMAAYMRQPYVRRRERGQGSVRYLQADSSMQHGKEFEAVYMMTVDCADLVPAFHNYNALIALRSIHVSCAEDNYSEEVQEDDKQLTEKLGDVLWDRHFLPLVALAGGRGSLSSKFQAVMHSCFTEGGGCTPVSCATEFPAFCRECATFTGDMGVEFGLPTVLPVRAKSVLPWFPDGDRQAQPIAEDDEWEFAPNRFVNPEISFCGALQIAGLRHVIHNASLDMLKVTPGFLVQVRSYLAPLSRLLFRK